MSEPKINSLEEFWVRADQRDPDGFARSRAAEEELAALLADAERLDWFQSNPSVVTRALEYVGSLVIWTFRDKNGILFDFDNLRAAIDAARENQA
jgi:hypothetical protein